jgi:CHAT domain-containing protein/Tfp pilus assembly protein PilF
MVHRIAAAQMFFLAAFAPGPELQLRSGGQGQLPTADGRASCTLVVERPGVVRITLDQGDVDLLATIQAPDGTSIKFDGFERGPEPVVFDAQQSGRFTLEIMGVASGTIATPVHVTWDSDGGRTDRDHLFVTAVRASTRAKQPDRKPAESLRDSEAAVSSWSRLNEPFWYAAALIRDGELLMGNARWEDSRQRFRDALVVNRTAKDDLLEAEGYNNAGICARHLGEIDEAVNSIEKALAIWTKHGFAKGIAAARTNRGVLYVQGGEFEKAILDYREAVESFRRMPGERSNQAITLSNLSLAYAAIGNFESAKSSLDEAASLVGKDDHLNAGKILMNTGYVLRLSGQVAEAERALRQAVARLRLTLNVSATADAVVQLAATLLEKNERSAAISAAREALTLYPASEKRGRAYALYLLGTAEGESNASDALNALQESLRLREDLEMPDAVAVTRWQIARIGRRNGRMAEARMQLEAATQIVESLRTHIASDPFRALYFSTKQAIFDDYVGLLMALGEHAAGFEAAERALARSLLDLLSESRAEITRGADPRLLAEAAKRRRELNYRAVRASQVLNAHPPADEAARVRRSLSDAVDALRAVEARIRVSNTRYAAFTSPQPSQLSDVQKELDPETVLVEYWLGDEQSFAWAVHQNTIRAFSLPARRQIDAWASGLREAVQRADMAAFSRIARRLSEAVLLPLQAEMQGRRLALVATGVLSVVPFEALPSPSSLASPSPEPLGVAHEITHFPSASLLVTLRRSEEKRPRAPEPAFVIADPVYHPRDARFGGRSPVRPMLGTDAPARLLFTRYLAEDVRRLEPRARLQLDFDASSTALTDPGMKRYRFVELGTHARVNVEHPELTAMLFSIADRYGKVSPDRLFQHDIYNRVTLNADLLVLNACSTGTGREIRGEGPAGLVRAFLYAGAKRVVASRWDTDDAAAYEFLRQFHVQLFGKPPRTAAAALRHAQRAMHFHRDARWRNPLYSAGYALYGDWRP